VGSVVQLILGVVIDKKFNPTRSEIPLRDKVHWWLGRVLFALSILNIFLGIAVANSGVIYWYFVYAAVVLITVGVFVWAQRSFGGQQHHQEKQLSDTIPMGGKFVNGHNNA
jgi:hypothetical protein